MLAKNFISSSCFSEKNLTEITLKQTASTQAEASNIIISEDILFLLLLILSLVYVGLWTKQSKALPHLLYRDLRSQPKFRKLLS